MCMFTKIALKFIIKCKIMNFIKLIFLNLKEVICVLEITGTIFIIVVGCISHFLYDWFHHNKILGYLVTVKEST